MKGHKLSWSVGFLSLLLLLVTACTPADDPTATAEPTATPRPTVPPTHTPTPGPTDTPTSTPTPAPMSANEVFNAVSSAIVYLETPVAAGSGVLLADGYILTNAHVVWPYDQVRVVFADGVEFLDVPVLNRDLLVDLAIVGPVETEVAPVTLVNGEGLVIGSDVFIIGYPGEREKFPVPTIGQGLISRMREWEEAGITYFQTDAAVAGGQSGGVLVSDLAQVIGITNFAFTEARYGIIASAGDIMPRVEQLLAGEDTAGLGERFKRSERSHYHSAIVDNLNAEKLFIVYAEAGDEVEISLSGATDGGFWVDGPDGSNVAYADEAMDGEERTSFVAEVSGPYFLGVFQTEYDRHIYTINASHDLLPLHDLDDRHIWTSGQAQSAPVTYHGGLDYPGDVDYFTMSLRQGDEIDIRVDSILMDPVITIDGESYRIQEVISDDDSGGGIFGLSARLNFRAPHRDEYVLTVANANPFSAGFGAYVLNLSVAAEDAPTPPAIAPTPTPISTDYGEMRVYESDRYPFVMQYPAAFEELNLQGEDSFLGALCGFDANCLAFGDILLAFVEEDVGALDIASASDYMDLVLEAVRIFAPELEIISRRPLVTQSGLAGEMVEYKANIMGQVQLNAVRFIYLHNDEAFSATYVVVQGDLDDEMHDGLRDTILYTFSTFDLVR